MAEADWTVCDDVLDANAVRRGATGGITPPPGDDEFVFAFNSTTVATGASALFYSGDEDFAPSAYGASITAAIQKGASGGTTGYTPLLFACLQGESVDDTAYFVAVSNNEPHKIVLCKGSLSTGPATDAILRQSTENFTIGTWLHLRLDVVENGNGDVALTVRRSNLNVDPVEDPTWAAIPGMATFIDDSTGINSGTVPLSGGRAGYGMWTTQTSRRAYVSHVTLVRQSGL